MPSLHIAWAVLVGFALWRLARPLAVRLCGLFYPLIVLIVLIVTGNHYLVDAVAALAVVGVAVLVARPIARRRG
jgi:PAP2 superfamily protein